MNRRHFISALIGAGAGLALEEAIPFNRVWFFPQKIRIARPGRFMFDVPGLAEQYREGVLTTRWDVIQGWSLLDGAVPTVEMNLEQARILYPDPILRVDQVFAINPRYRVVDSP